MPAWQQRHSVGQSQTAFPTWRVIGRLQPRCSQQDKVYAYVFPETLMPKSTRGPRPAGTPTEDRKAIEQRARDATAPFTPKKKGQWPFMPEDINGSSGNNGDAQPGSSSQPDR
jgi:hypothetical protein